MISKNKLVRLTFLSLNDRSDSKLASAMTDYIKFRRFITEGLSFLFTEVLDKIKFNKFKRPLTALIRVLMFIDRRSREFLIKLHTVKYSNLDLPSAINLTDCK